MFNKSVRMPKASIVVDIIENINKEEMVEEAIIDLELSQDSLTRAVAVYKAVQSRLVSLNMTSPNDPLLLKALPLEEAAKSNALPLVEAAMFNVPPSEWVANNNALSSERAAQSYALSSGIKLQKKRCTFLVYCFPVTHSVIFWLTSVSYIKW